MLESRMLVVFRICFGLSLVGEKLEGDGGVPAIVTSSAVLTHFIRRSLRPNRWLTDPLRKIRKKLLQPGIK